MGSYVSSQGAYDTYTQGFGPVIPRLPPADKLQARMFIRGTNTKVPLEFVRMQPVSGAVTYPIDIWGGERRQVEVLGAAVDAQRYALAGAYVMLTSNVIDAVIALAAYRDEIEVTKATLILLGEQVRIANAQATDGTVPYSNVLSLQSQLASTEATLPPLEEKIDQAADLLAALTGVTPRRRHHPERRPRRAPGGPGGARHRQRRVHRVRGPRPPPPHPPRRGPRGAGRALTATPPPRA